MQARTPKTIRTARIEPAVAAPTVTVWLERLGILERGAAVLVGPGWLEGETGAVVFKLEVDRGAGESDAGVVGLGEAVYDVIDCATVLDASLGVVA